MCCDLAQRITTTTDFLPRSVSRAQIAAYRSWRAIRLVLPTPRLRRFGRSSRRIVKSICLPIFAIFVSIAELSRHDVTTGLGLRPHRVPSGTTLTAADDRYAQLSGFGTSTAWSHLGRR